MSILTKFKGCSSKIGSAMPVWCFRRFWREIQIFGTYDLDFLTTYVILVLITPATFDKFNIENFYSSKSPQLRIKSIFKNYFTCSWRIWKNKNFKF